MKRKPTIRAQGLRSYLGDELYMKFVHSYKYQSLLAEQHINATAVGKVIGVDYRTAKKYITIHEEEQNKQKDGNNAEVHST